MPFSVPTKAAAAIASGPDTQAAPRPPTVPSSDSQNRQRRRPRRSPAQVTITSASVAPARPAESTTPMAAAEKPICAKVTPSSTPAMPVASARRKAAV